MSKFEFVKNDGTILDFSTSEIEVQKSIVVNVKVPLWESVGKHISFDKLEELGLSVKYTADKTEDRLNYEKITFMYENVEEFSTRVQELKEKYDYLGVEYNSTVEDISNALKEKLSTTEERATFLAEFNSLLDKGVKLNYQAGMRLYCEEQGINLDPVDDFVMWTDFPILVKWLPGTYEESDIPAEEETKIITSFEEENSIIK